MVKPQKDTKGKSHKGQLELIPHVISSGNSGANRVDRVKEILRRYLPSHDSTPFNHNRYLLVDKTAYLTAFVEKRAFPPFEVEIQMSSECNLSCAWCIGAEVQSEQCVFPLRNNIKPHNIRTVTDGLIRFKIGGLKVDTVKFSGFIGEPLMNKQATLDAIRTLKGEGFRIGLFTNGVLIDDEVSATLANVHYVHFSLDAGRESFWWLKEQRWTGYRERRTDYNEANYEKVIGNIRRLNEDRRKLPQSPLAINVGYVIVKGNQRHIFDAAKDVKEAGADSIRFKCDIGGRHSLKGDTPDSDGAEQAYEQIRRVTAELADESFQVYQIHSEEDVRNETYRAWNCANGCYFHHFMTTIGSNGNVYLCDHNSTPASVPLGNCLDKKTPLAKIWTSERRRRITDNQILPYLCQCYVCPPFGNNCNPFLKALADQTEEHGAPTVVKAMNEIKKEYE